MFKSNFIIQEEDKKNLSCYKVWTLFSRNIVVWIVILDIIAVALNSALQERDGVKNVSSFWVIENKA